MNEIPIRKTALGEQGLRKSLDALAKGVPAVSGASQAAFNPATISGLTFSNPPTQAECNALRDALVPLAQLVNNGLRQALVDQKIITGGA